MSRLPQTKATLTLILIAVAFGEKEMNLSPSAASPPWRQGFLVEKVKWEKVGRRKTEGWERKVFRNPL